jgi:hypothetical protein
MDRAAHSSLPRIRRHGRLDSDGRRASATSPVGGSGSTSTVPAATPREELAIAQVSERLQRRFPTLPPAEIDLTVERHYHQFDQSRIRDFVPIFVERNVREDLTRRMPV